MAGADVAGVLRVVGEVLVAQQAVLVADQAIGPHARGIELHLELHVLRDRDQRAAHLLHEHLARLEQVVDVGVVAVPVVGELLHLRVLVVPHAEAEDGEERALRCGAAR